MLYSLGQTEDKAIQGVQAVGKGGRHLSLPIEPSATNGDLCE